MSVRLFVGNVAHEATEAEVRDLFATAGRPTFVRLPTDRETNAPRGFAFVEFGEQSEAEEAIRTLDRQLFKGRPLSVSEARPKAPSTVRSPEFPYSATTETEPRPAGRTINRTFGPDAPARGKRKPEYRGDGRVGASTGRARPAPARAGFAELDGPDDFDLWKAADRDRED